MQDASAYILGIESSCDETAAAVLKNDMVLSNVIATQALIHQQFGGVVPELASRAHQQKIIPVIEEALRKANITKNDLHAVAVTTGPGLMGALHVGVAFAKAFATGLGIPLISVNHLEGHSLVHFIRNHNREFPTFPFLGLTVSGGHTQIVRVNATGDMKILGQTNDDAAGEAFDKAAKILGLPYPGGPLIDKLAKEGDPEKFRLPHPKIDGYDFSFSGLKTAFLYLVRDGMKQDSNFIQNNLADLCASMQKTVIDVLMDKLIKAAADTGISEVAITGGVSANSRLRSEIISTGKAKGWRVFIPPFEYCTDNAAMIGIAGYFKHLKKEYASFDVSPVARTS